MKLSRSLAKRFCEALASSDQALFEVLKQHPEFPPWKTLTKWRDNKPWFSAMWKRAREEQGEHLAQKCLDIAAKTTPKNAHQCRVQYDIYKWVASRFAPAVYGDRPVTAPTVNVGIGVTLSSERLQEIRSKLNVTRETLRNTTVAIKDTPTASRNGKVTKTAPLRETTRTDVNNQNSGA